MKTLKSQVQAGFSLVELMIVVAIIGLLATVAVPKFEIFRAKARQVEAKNNLSHIYTLQHAFFGDNEDFSSLPSPVGFRLGAGSGCANVNNDLGFYLRPCDDGTIVVRYSYTATASSNTEFTAQAITGTGAANKVVPGCDTADQWQINQDKSLTLESNAIGLCQ